ncbi:MAG: glucose/sorbosone family PQQ-dependent dehydrogenase [Bryobacteraceae bacterium]
MKNLVRQAISLLPFFCVATLLAQDGPETVIRGSKRFERRVVVSGLAGPWEITWGPDGKLWVTERTGRRIVRVDPATGERQVAASISEAVAPGGQDGVLGMALDPHLLKGSGNDFVYVAYTYVDKTKAPDTQVSDPASPYRHLFGKIVRLTYNPQTGTLSDSKDVITGLPAGNDHNALRLKIGPDRKLYLTVGDQGNNQLGNFCLPVLAQRLPTKKEVKDRDFAAYEGKSLRLNLDGSVPKDNPKLAGVVSHVYTYGHRNPQGLDFSPDGTLYSSEHGPKTDDEINILKAGSNHGWPHVAGMRDNKAYEYARWAESKKGCSELSFSDLAIDPSVPREPESAFTQPFVEPIATMFTVPTGFNFQDPVCKGFDYICWPTVGVSGVEHYSARNGGIPGWDPVLLITTLKRGSLYVLPLTADGKRAAGPMSRYFQSENRYRDTAVSPDGRTLYIATDFEGLAESLSGGATSEMQDKGAILAFTYVGEGDPSRPPEPAPVSRTRPSAAPPVEFASAHPQTQIPPRFTASQAATGKKAYDAYCAVCHGSTLTNGTFGTPLAGEQFKTRWPGRSVGTLYDKSRTMPPTTPGSLPKETYADIVAYILGVNGLKPGGVALPAGGDTLRQMRIE